jgi:hypothetical protein
MPHGWRKDAQTSPKKNHLGMTRIERVQTVNLCTGRLVARAKRYATDLRMGFGGAEVIAAMLIPITEQDIPGRSNSGMIAPCNCVSVYAALRRVCWPESRLWQSLFCYAEKTNISNGQRGLRMCVLPKSLSKNSRELFARLGAMGFGNRFPRFGEAGWRGNDIGRRFQNIRERISTRSLNRAQKFRCGQGRLVQRGVMLQHPTRQHGLGCFLNPLVNQHGDFTLQICSVVQPCQLKTLQRGPRSCVQIVERRSNTGNGHR